MQYQCPRCGNSQQFVQYQWQLRKLTVDGEGLTLAPDEICAAEVIAAVACAQCNTHVRDFGVDLHIQFPYGIGPHGRDTPSSHH